MIEIIFISIVVLVVLLYAHNETHKTNRGLLKIKQYEENFQKSVKEFEFFTDGAKYFNNKKYEKWNEKYDYLSEKINFDLSKATIEKEFKETIRKYLKYKNNARKIIDFLGRSLLLLPIII